MDDYYQILGVARTSTQDEIKSAYRKLASKHHPDRGGDTATFQKIQSAYNILSDPQKRAEYDNPRPQGFGFQGPQGFGFHGPQGFEFHGPQGFEDILRGFGGFGDIFGQRSHQARNLTLNLQTSVTLEDAFFGKDLIANITLPSGRDQIINVKIPQGITDGTVLRLKEIGDDSISGIPRGDVHLTVSILPNNVFQRVGDDLIKEVVISAYDAILGKSVEIETIDQKHLMININPGIQPGTTLKLHGQGMPNIKDPRFRGNLLLKINVFIPTNLTEHQKILIEQVRNQ